MSECGRVKRAFETGDLDNGRGPVTPNLPFYSILPHFPILFDLPPTLLSPMIEALFSIPYPNVNEQLIDGSRHQSS